MATINIDSVMRMEKKNYPQDYLEEWKKKMTRFIDTELGLDDSDGFDFE